MKIKLLAQLFTIFKNFFDLACLMPGSSHILVEVWFDMNGPSKLAALISSKQFFGVQLCLKCSSLAYLLKFIRFEQNKVYFVYSKLNLRPKNGLQEI